MFLQFVLIRKTSFIQKKEPTNKQTKKETRKQPKTLINRLKYNCRSSVQNLYQDFGHLFRISPAKKMTWFRCVSSCSQFVSPSAQFQGNLSDKLKIKYMYLDKQRHSNTYRQAYIYISFFTHTIKSTSMEKNFTVYFVRKCVGDSDTKQRCWRLSGCAIIFCRYFFVALRLKSCYFMHPRCTILSCVKSVKHLANQAILQNSPLIAE